MARNSYRFTRTLDLEFSVINSNHVRATYPPDFVFCEKCTGQIRMRLMFFELYDLMVDVLLIQTRKHQKLNLFLNGSEFHQVWLFDGPGPLCPQKKVSSPSTYSLSSFQALLYITQTNFRQANMSLDMQFFSILKLHPYLLAKGEERTLSSRDKEFHTCRQQKVIHCVIRISAPSTSHGAKCLMEYPWTSCPNCCLVERRDWYINTTVQLLWFEGHNGGPCLFGGLNIHQPDPKRDVLAACWLKYGGNQQMRQILTDHEKNCDPFSKRYELLMCSHGSLALNNTLPKPMIVVSEDNHIIVTFYHYGNYVNEFEFALHVKLTHCQGVLVSVDEVPSILDAHWGKHPNIPDDFTDKTLDYGGQTHSIVVHLKFDTDWTTCSNMYRNNFVFTKVLRSAIHQVQIQYYQR